MMDTITHIDALALKKNKLLAHKAARELNESAGEMATSAYENNALRPKDKRIPTSLQTLRRWGREVDATILKMEQFVDWMDGGDPDGPWRKLVFTPISEAQNRRNDIIAATGAMFEVARDRMSEEAQQWMQKKHQVLGEPYYGYELVMVALNVGNESNLSKLQRGFNWNEETGAEVLTMIEGLSAEHWQFVQDVWDMLESLRPLMEETELQMTGLKPKWIQPREFVTKYGQVMRGGYFPAVYDPDKNRQVYGYGEQSDAALFEWSFGKPDTPHGHMEERKEKFASEMLLDINVVSRHIARVVHDATFRPVLSDTYKLLRHPDVQTAVDAVMGPEYTRQLVPWLHGIANQYSTDLALAKWESLMRTGRHNTTIMIMGWKATTAFTQLAGIGPSVEVLSDHLDRNGKHWIRLGMQEFFRHPMQVYEEIAGAEGLSGEMRHRFARMDRDLEEGMRNLTNTAGTLRSLEYHMKKSAFYGIGMFDMAVSLSTWKGAFLQATQDGRSQETAVQYADAMVRMSQGAGEAKDLTAYQRGGQKQSEAIKLLSMFMGYFSAYYSRQRASGRSLRQTRDFSRFMMKHWWMTILPVIMSEVLTGNGPPEGSDEKEQAKWWAGQLIAYSGAGVPLLREGLSSEVRGFRYRFTPIETPLEVIWSTIFEDIPHVLTGEWEPDVLYRHAVQNVGYLRGLPLEQPLNITLPQSLDMVLGEEPPSFHDVFFRRKDW
jgi:hypothetical protein